MEKDTPKTEIEEAKKTAAEIIHNASTLAKEVVSQAETVAAALAKSTLSSEERITKSLADALREVFDANIDSGRFVDVKRIPLICASIVSQANDIKSIKEDLKWAVRIVIGAVLLGLLALLFK